VRSEKIDPYFFAQSFAARAQRRHEGCDGHGEVWWRLTLIHFMDTLKNEKKSGVEKRHSLFRAEGATQPHLAFIE
jgi:hypothetical protein